MKVHEECSAVAKQEQKASICCNGQHPIVQDAAAQDDYIQRQIAMRLAEEVRNTISRCNISVLRKQVQSGDYQINPLEIAAAMLLRCDCQ